MNSAEPDPKAIVLQGHENAITAVAFSPDNRRFVSGSEDKTARIWDMNAENTAAKSTILRGHEGAITALAISQDGHWLATGSGDTTARVWDLHAKDPAASATILRRDEESSGNPLADVVTKVLRKVQVLALSRDGRWLVTGSISAHLWDLSARDPAPKPIDLAIDYGGSGTTDRLARVIVGINTMAISTDGHWLVIGSGNTARLFDLTAKNPAAAPIVLRGHEKNIRALSVSANNRWLATGSDDKTTRLWDLSADDPAAAPIVLRGHNGPILEITTSADSRWVATRSEDNTIRLWHLHLPDLIALARITTGRNLFPAEWAQYFPGQPYRKTFPDLPDAEDRF